VLPVAARRWVLTENTFWHAQWDLFDYFIDYMDYFLRLHQPQLTASSSSATSTSTVKMPNENPITYEELSDEHKQKYNDIKALFEADLIGSFEKIRQHGIRWKGFSSEGALDEVDLSTPTEEHTRALRQEVNYMVAHSLQKGPVSGCLLCQSLISGTSLRRQSKGRHWLTSLQKGPAQT
jgi:hypothetical protein